MGSASLSIVSEYAAEYAAGSSDDTRGDGTIETLLRLRLLTTAISLV